MTRKSDKDAVITTDRVLWCSHDDTWRLRALRDGVNISLERYVPQKDPDKARKGRIWSAVGYYATVPKAVMAAADRMATAEAQDLGAWLERYRAAVRTLTYHLDPKPVPAGKTPSRGSTGA